MLTLNDPDVGIIKQWLESSIITMFCEKKMTTFERTEKKKDFKRTEILVLKNTLFKILKNRSVNSGIKWS